MKSTKPTRTRFAPSPTGYVHLGSVRTALYNYLFAKQHDGTYILRIEDTDQTRKVDGAVENLISIMSQLGMPHDEGPYRDGSNGPYFQSKRLQLYANKVKQLLDSGHAYYCFCAPERLTRLREEQQAQNLPQGYDKHCRDLSPETVQANLKDGKDFVIRLKVPQDKKIVFTDLVRGQLEFDSNLIDDQILIKSDGFPTYHFANVVDDHDMDISHVIRGEEWVTSTPKHILLYQAFGWETPSFAHLPLILNPDRSKLSKRQGDVAVEDFLKAEFCEETLINFLALLGWNPGSDREFFNLEELVSEFSLQKVSKSGAVFDREKLNWMNSQYHKKYLPEQRFLELVKPYANMDELKSWSPNVLDKVLLTLRNQIDKPEDIKELLSFFLGRPTVETLRGQECSDILKIESNNRLFRFIVSQLQGLDSLSSDGLRSITRSAQKDLGIKGKSLFMPLRVALTGATSGPEVFVFAEGLGKQECLERLLLAHKVHQDITQESE